jgi:[acyl-carrier-protein] S-malonyltransferase
MGADLVKQFECATGVFARASETVGYDMAKLCFEGPASQLDLTRYTQPALLTHQIACLEAFRSLVGADVQPVLAGGHSLGEYAALVVAGALSFENALSLVARRGELMSEYGRGSMVATTLDMESARGLAEAFFCGIGGCNLPEQTVIAGEDRDLDQLLVELGTRVPGKKGVRLNTEGAFHTYLMVTAAQKFRPVLESVEFGGLDVAVLSNYTGKLHDSDPNSLRSRLFFQLFNPVRWVACMNTAIDQGVDTIIEFGGGIGKGEAPDGKRANLESIIKKSLRWREREAAYLPAINAVGIRAAASQLVDG